MWHHVQWQLSTLHKVPDWLATVYVCVCVWLVVQSVGRWEDFSWGLGSAPDTHADIVRTVSTGHSMYCTFHVYTIVALTTQFELVSLVCSV